MVIRRLTPSDDIDHVSRVYARSWKTAYQGIVPQEYLDSLPENRRS
jgi:predicted GNAT superfamily acetyltransferase